MNSRYTYNNIARNLISLVLYLILVLFVSFVDPCFAEDFTATTIGDYGNITVMEVTGNYDAVLPDGFTNELPRQEVAKEFSKNHTDDYDFLVIFSNFDFQMPEGDARAFYLGVRNDTLGIGREVFDNSGFYGSSGKLQGILDMGDVSRLPGQPLDPGFEDTLYLLAHEVMHRWGAYVKFKDAAGNVNDGLLHFEPEKHAAHWSFLFDSAGSVLYGNDWQDNGDGTFTSIGARRYYSPLDLYLMGFYDKSRIPPMLLVENPEVDPARPSELGATISGTPRYVTIDDIIATEGERTPGPSESQKSFKMAFILLTTPGTFTSEELHGLENIREGWITRFSVLTDGMGMMEVASTLKEDLPANPGITLPPVTPRTVAPNIDDGVTWLVNNQEVDGSWQDSSQTGPRDTVEAVLALRNFAAAQPNYSQGLQWLGGSDSANLVYLARKIEALVGTGDNVTAFIEQLLSGQNADGGWGSNRYYMSNPLDTSFALKALAAVNYAGNEVLAKAIAYLKSNQNSDGGWGGTNGKSTIESTANVLCAFNRFRQEYSLDDEITKGLAWLIQRQNPDHGFGNSPSTVYDTAMAVVALREFDVSPEIINHGVNYILDLQSEDGSWYESPHQTALAVQAVWKATIDPDLSVKAGDVTITPSSVTSLPAAIQIQAEMWNLGRTEVDEARVVLYDGGVSDEYEVDEQILAMAGQSSTSITFSVTITDGEPHNFYLVLDPANIVGESNEVNNVALKQLSPVSNYDFELLPSNVSVSADPVDFFEDVAIASKITNKGTVTAYDVQVRYYVDGPGGPFDIATHTVNLPAGATVDHTITWKAGKAGDSLPITVQVDPFNLFDELSEANNKASTSLTVNQLTEPNLTISHEDMAITPSPAYEGGDVSISALVRNEGFSSASGIQVDFYRGVPGEGGELLGSQTIASLDVGESTSVSAVWTGISGSGDKIVYVQVDPENTVPEFSEKDNAAFKTIQVLSLPDLVVSTGSIVLTPPAPRDGEAVSIDVTVQNGGEQEATGVTVTLYEGNTEVGSEIVDTLAANCQTKVSFAFDTTAKSGAHEIRVLVDPNNTISELSETNNEATKTFGVQDADLWLTEPYISPDGDGVKDSTRFFFRLEVPQSVTIAVINEKGEVVRTFSGSELENALGGTVAWDGLDDQGKVVGDGQYQIQVVDENNSILSSLRAVVDNNRSPLADAIGTRHLLHTTIASGLRYEFFYYRFPDDSGVLLVDDGRLANISVDGESVFNLSLEGGFNDRDPETPISPDGETIAFLDAGWKVQTLWTVGSDGSNLTKLDRVVCQNGDPIQTVEWSPDSNYIAYGTVCAVGNGDAPGLFVSKPDGTEKIKLRDGWTYAVYWAPDSKRVATTDSHYIDSGYITTIEIYDLTGNKQEINLEGIHHPYLEWYDNQYILAYFPDYTIDPPKGKVVLLDTSEAGTHSTLFELSSHPDGVDWYDSKFVRSPDQESYALLFRDYRLQRQYIYVFDIKGNVYVHEFIPCQEYSSSWHRDVWIENLVWSPDSTRLSFVEGCSVEDEDGWMRSRTNLVVIDAKTQTETLFTVPEMQVTGWLSDGVSIVGEGPIWSHEEYTIYVVHSETGKATPLVPREGLKGDSGVSPLGNYIDYTFFTDSYRRDLITATSLLNLTAHLRVARSQSHLALKGIAQDLNFEGYKLEYADIEDPENWNLIAPPADTPVVNGEFATWVPPHEGTFHIRLTVWDKAGNVAWDIKRVSWGRYSSITNIYKTYEMFSPNGDGTKDTVELHYRALEPVHLEFYVYDEDGGVVRTFQKDHASPEDGYISWDGTDESGTQVADGKYAIQVFDYKFFVQADNTPPVADLELSPVQQQADLQLYVDMFAHAVDDNLRHWVVEWGEGNNPQEWHECYRGVDQLAAKDEDGNYILEPIENEKVNRYSTADQIAWLAGKRLRITAEDLAGNRSTRITDFLEQRIVFYKWGMEDDFEPFDIKTGLITNTHGPARLGLIETIREEIASITVQYFEQDDWHDAVTVDDPASGYVEITWDTSQLDRPNYPYVIRVKVIDILGNDYYSNGARMNLFKIFDTCPLYAFNPYLDLQLLTIQVKRPGDPVYWTWTDNRVITSTDGIPTGVFYLPLDRNLLKEGISYQVRMVGTGPNGERYGSNEETYWSSCRESNLRIEVEYEEAKGCNAASPGKASVVARVSGVSADTLSQGTLTYSIVHPDNSREVIGVLHPIGSVNRVIFGEGTPGSEPFGYEPGKIIVDTSGREEGAYQLEAVLEIVNDALGTQELEATGELVVDRTLPTAEITYPGESLLVCPVSVPDPTGGWYGVPIEGKATDDQQVKRYELYRGSEKTNVAGKGAVQGVLGTWDVTGLDQVNYPIELRVVDVAGNLSCFATSFTPDTLAKVSSLTVEPQLFSPDGDGVLDQIEIRYQTSEYASIDIQVFGLMRNDNGSYALGTSVIRNIELNIQHLGGSGTAIWDGKGDSGAVMTDGKYGIAVTATDSCGNKDTEWIAVDVRSSTSDETPPEVVLHNPKEGEVFGFGKGVVNISGTIVEENLQAYSLRYGVGANPTQWTNLFTGSSLPADPLSFDWQVGAGGAISDGDYTLSLHAIDTGGLEGEARVRVFVDSTPPEVSITSPGEGSYVKGPADIRGTAFDPHLETYRVETAQGNCSGAFKWVTIATRASSVQAGSLAVWKTLPLDGDYCVLLRAADSLGNEAEAKINVTIDTKAPEPPALSGEVENKADARLSWTENQEPDLAGYNIYRSSNKLNTELLTETIYLDQNLSEGTHTYQVKAVDLSGWESEASNEIQLVIDAKGPSVKISSPQEGATVGQVVEVKGTAFSSDDFKQYRVYVGQGAEPTTWNLIRTSPVPVSSGTLTQWNTAGLGGDTPYAIKLEGEDISGNVETHQITVTIDNTAPAAPILLSATPVGSDVALTWQANTEPDLAGYLLYRNGQPVNASGMVVGDLKRLLLTGTTYQNVGVPDGTSTYHLVAMDEAGNLSTPSNAISVAIDVRPPHADIVEPAAGFAFEQKILVRAETPDHDIAFIQFQYKRAEETGWTDLGAPLATQPYVTYLDPTVLKMTYGDHHLRAVATDTGGQTDPSPSFVSVSYTDLTAPEVPGGLSASISGEAVALSWAANSDTDLDGYNVFRMWTDNEGEKRVRVNAAIVKEVTYEDVGLADGLYAYEITAVDTFGNESGPSGSVSATVYTPFVEQPYTPTGENTVELRGAYAQADSSVELFVDTGSGPVSQGETISDGEGNFSFSATLALGENRMTARVTDSSGNVSKDSEVVVVVYNEPPLAVAGLTGSVQDYDVSLTWNANTESDLSGYNLYRNGVRLNAPSQVTSGIPSAYGSLYYPDRAFDGNESTYWYCYFSDSTPYQWWQLDDLTSPDPGDPNQAVPKLISRIEVEWYGQEDSTLYAAGDYEIQVWSGDADSWITQAKVTGNISKLNTFDFNPSYRTDRIRIYITARSEVSSSILLGLAEVRVYEDNLITEAAYEDASLDDGEYRYNATAVDYYGFESEFSVDLLAVVGDATAPEPPQNLTAVASGSQVTLNWSANSEADLAGYSVYRETEQGWLKLSSSLLTEPTYIDADLANGSYTYRVAALDATGNESQPSNEASATVMIAVPPAPVTLSITAVPEGEALIVSWQYVTGLVAGYNLYRSLTSGGPYTKINEGLLSTTDYLDTGLSNEVAYYYVVVAVDALGNEGGRSNEAMGVPDDTLPPQAVEPFFPPKSEGCTVVYGNRTAISGMTEPGITVELFQDSIFVGSGTSFAGESWQVNFDYLGDGASLSADGRTLAYSYRDSLWLMGVATGSTNEIVADGYAYQPQWSPDGSKVAFVSYSNGYNRFLIYDTESGTSDFLTDDEYVTEQDLSWSADGSMIAFRSTRGGPWQIWVKNLISGSLTQVSASSSARYPRLSPDGQNLAYFESSSLYVMGLASGDALEVDTQTDRYSLSWSPDGQRLAYLAYLNDRYDLFVFDLSTQEKVQITDSAQREFLPVWSPGGNEIAFARWEDGGSAAVWRASLHTPQEQKLIQQGLGNPSYLFWADTGQVACIDDNTLNMFEIEGYFSLENVELNPGDNIFSILGTDPYGNVGPLSEEFCITFDTSQLPDLETRGASIFIYPPSPLEEEAVTITVPIRNNSQVGVGDVEVDIYLLSASGSFELLRSEVIPSLAPGQEEAIRVHLEKMGEIGTNTILVYLDPDDAIVEANESNNVAIRDFFVAGEEAISMTTTLDADQYQSGDDVNIEVTLRNSGVAQDVIVEVWIEDGDGNAVTLLDVLTSHLPYGSEESYDLVWNTGATYAGPYRVHSILRNPPDVIAENITPFTILADKEVATTVTTDRAHYGPREDVVVRFDVTNRGGNYVSPELNIKVSIFDSGDSELFTDNKKITNLLPGATASLISTWNTGLNLPGDYRAIVEVLVDGQVVSSRSASFMIESSTAITGSLTVDPPVVVYGNNVQADYTIRNSGNMDLDDLALEVIVTDPETQEVMASHAEVVDLAMNTVWSGHCSFQTLGHELKTYTVTLRHTYQEKEGSLASISFRVRDGRPPVVFVVSPEEGDSKIGVALSLLAMATDDASGVDWVEYRVDQGPWTILALADVSKGVYGTTWTPTSSDLGTHTIRYRAVDKSGNRCEPVTLTFTVIKSNEPPVADAGADQTANEGEAVTFSGSFADPDPDDTHTIGWDFGDGSTASGNLTPTHAYAENGVYTVTLTVTDKEGEVGENTLTVTVNNVAPVVSELVSNSPTNGVIDLSGTFFDQGWLDSHTCTFNFGDGTGGPGEVVEEHEEPDATGTITGTCNYSEEGRYTVSVVVEDDDGGSSDQKTTEVLIDKTLPEITISEPKAAYYDNTKDISIHFEVEDPVSNGVSSGVVEESVFATLDGQVAEDGQIIDLSELADGTHTFKVVALDYAGNQVEEEVDFEVGAVDATIHIEPQRWSLSWLDPFDDCGGKGSKGCSSDKKHITAYLSLENAEVETVIPTFAARGLKVGKGYGDFVVVEIVAARDYRRHRPKKTRSVTLKYMGTDEVDVLASSGNMSWDFYGVKKDDTITMDAGEGEYLGSFTVLSYYKYGAPLYSAADIMPETIRLNDKVPIVEGSAELITMDPLQLGQSRAIVEGPFSIVREGRHHVWLTHLGDPERITLEVGNQTIFEDEPYPIRWHDRFSLQEDGEMQMMGIFASKKKDLLHVLHHNLQEEAKIYLDGSLALTILPDVSLVVLQVQFDRFDAVSSLPKEVLERGGDWQVTTYAGVKLLNKHSRKHVLITRLGDPQKAKLVVGDEVIFDNEPFPIKWADRYFMVDGERQDMSIYTFGHFWRNKYLSISCGRLTRDAKLYLDGELVLVISPPPDIEVNITGDLEFDGDPETFDGSFSGMDAIELEGKIPPNYDTDKTYQRIDTSGSPKLEVGDMFGDFELLSFTEGYDEYRLTMLEFRYDGRRKKQVGVYEDSPGKHLIGSYKVYPGDRFSVDTSEVEGDVVYLKVEHRSKAVPVAGTGVAEVGDEYLDCAVIDTTKRPEGPPHYIDLTLEYRGAAEPISITAYDGDWWAVIGNYEVDPAFESSFTIDGSGLHKGHIGEDLVLEY